MLLTKVLKDKLALEQESKKFFKEHCQKAEQEIHRLNCLRQQELEARLHNEKKSLEQLAFQQIIVERNDMRQDQRLLREIRQQLLNRADHLDVNSNSNVETVDSGERPYLEERHIRRAT
ncbi:hypothetical protein J6590_035917 [Homalodisca vitripennis]|nr:hypothetical protein J6590_035917 [Homalodisca vitripennis]